MGDVIDMEAYRATHQRRKKAKIERRERQKKRLSRSRGEASPETSLQAGKGRLEDDPK
jgi:hypothetical protein